MPGSFLFHSSTVQIFILTSPLTIMNSTLCQFLKRINDLSVTLNSMISSFSVKSISSLQPSLIILGLVIKNIFVLFRQKKKKKKKKTSRIFQVLISHLLFKNLQFEERFIFLKMAIISFCFLMMASTWPIEIPNSGATISPNFYDVKINNNYRLFIIYKLYFIFIKIQR